MAFRQLSLPNDGQRLIVTKFESESVSQNVLSLWPLRWCYIRKGDLDLEATIRWAEAVKFIGTTGSGHSVVMDGPADHGGENVGARPMEMLLLGLGGCASFDVVHILKKSRQKVAHCEAKVTAERADTVPAVFTKIHLHFRVSGLELKASQVERAVKLSAEKYCSASRMLEEGGVSITHSFEIINS